MKKLLMLLFVLGLATFLFAQDAPELKVRLGGSVQSMVSYASVDSGDALMGVGLRRVRLRAYASFGKSLKGFIQYSAKSNKVLDARITYIFSPQFNVRIGRFIGAGMKAGGLTSHTSIDIVERPVSAQKWGAMTIGADYRDYGIAFFGKKSMFKYNLTLQNGNGAKNITSSHKSNNNALSVSGSGMTVSGMASVTPMKALEVGGYYGVGNKNYNEYTSYSAYVYYQPEKFRFKAEMVSIEKDPVTSMGYYVFGAYRATDNIEVLGRYEQWDANTDIDNNEETDITIGATYSMFPNKWKASKITVAYVLQQEDPSIDNNVLYAMFQLIF